MANIPVVDMSDADSNQDLIRVELDKAFSTVGFVYLKNHGIEQRKVDKVLATSKTFFNQATAVKEQFPRDDETFDGYTGIDQEMLEGSNQHEVREAYDVTSPKSVYPDDCAPGFRQAVSDLTMSLRQLTLRLLKHMSLALGLEEEFLCNRHQFMFDGVDKNATLFRSLFYPPLTGDDIQPGVVRCGEHSDYGTITLLLQDDIGGLEVLSGRDWISAVPIPGTILVNLGDLMQFWTGDRYVATVHRVRIPEEEIRRRTARQSIAFFVQPDNGVMIEPLDGSRKYAPVEALAYLKQRFSATYKY